MTEHDDPTLERHAKRLLDCAANDLDADTLARLRAARARAWQRAASEPGPRPRRRGWLAVGGLAVAGLVLAVAGTLWTALPGSTPLGGVEDAELLASKESPEFYAEIDFYQWLAHANDRSG